ncbi:Uncharacterised protein [Mycobacteroides abscessus subsp. bolletii]|uniref:hypothetical protein n=1 Tax=Mycobacteroides abscessus TaxID=36809 RepID=UPI000926C0FE|nr:hypothetical protein [Mycobacteroides abscessus]SHZ35929.1 Uncharacterised protein [Mycobacteroides abscessus subsp. bolletii]SIB00676.1 Uncharacterised protein [Mycobacteroides abscessus subsp. bolletii]
MDRDQQPGIDWGAARLAILAAARRSGTDRDAMVAAVDLLTLPCPPWVIAVAAGRVVREVASRQGRPVSDATPDDETLAFTLAQARGAIGHGVGQGQITLGDARVMLAVVKLALAPSHDEAVVLAREFHERFGFLDTVEVALSGAALIAMIAALDDGNAQPLIDALVVETLEYQLTEGNPQ